LTEDHSEGERLFKAGKISKEDLREYPRKNILDSALGIHSKPKIDTFKFDIAHGDRVFFTTDGVHQKILLREMRECSARHERAGSFVAEVASIVSSRGADDNFSLLAVFVH
jgi:protein phosphatase